MRDGRRKSPYTRFVRDFGATGSLSHLFILFTISLFYSLSLCSYHYLFILITIFSLFQTHKKVGVRLIAYWCVRDSEAGLLWRFHEVYMLVVVLILPLTIMAFCYATICWEIWRVMKRRYHMTSRHA